MSGFIQNYLTHLIHYQYQWPGKIHTDHVTTAIYFYVTLSQNYKRIPKPLIFLVFVFVENTINKYICAILVN